VCLGVSGGFLLSGISLENVEINTMDGGHGLEISRLVFRGYDKVDFLFAFLKQLSADL
jgi:hypothetical protein